MSVFDTGAASPHCYLLKFTWGNANVARYAAWDDDVTVGGFVYESLPTIAIKPEAVQGGVDEKPWLVQMTAASPLDQIATGFPHAEVKVTISECAPDDPDNTVRTLYWGRLGKMNVNAGGRRGVMAFEVEGVRLMMRGKIFGIPATTQCAWTFGDKGCCVDVASLRETAEITAISGLGITLDALTTTTERYWHQGFAELDGLRIMIRSYETGLTMTLARRPPASWLNETIRLTPGCDKTIETCRNRWNNESRFGGVGYKIPAYHPVLDAP